MERSRGQTRPEEGRRNRCLWGSARLRRASVLLALGLLFSGAAWSETLDVMTFNLRIPVEADGPDTWELRKPRVVAILERYRPDLVGTQEAQPHMLDYLVGEASDYAWLGMDRDGTGRGETNGILYRKERFLVHSATTVWLSETPQTPGSRSWGNRLPRVITCATLECRPAGARLVFINTHFDHQSQESRERSALAAWDLVQSLGDELPAILVGDLNAGPDNPAIRFLRGQDELLGRRARLPDAFSALGVELAERYTFTGFRDTGRPGAVIDWIFFTPDVTPQSVQIIDDRIDGRWPSDHLPVQVRVKLPTP